MRVPKPDAGRERDDPLPGPGVDLPPALRAVLLDPAAWHEGLEQYAQTTNLAAALTDANGLLLGSVLNPQPLWNLLHAHQQADLGGCPFCLAPVQRCTSVADALANGGKVLARDRTGLVHFAVPLRLGEHRLGALLAGQVFTQYPDQLPLEHMAKQFGVSAHAVWQSARLEHPVKPATLCVYADLLATLGQTFLQSHYHALTEAERLAEMTQLRDQLGEAHRRKDEFLATLAHELRNPLAPIRNSVQVIRLAEGNGEVIEQARQTIERQLTQMVRLVDDLLDMSRISRNNIELRKEQVALAIVLQSAVEISRPLIEASGHELTVTLPPHTVWLNADLTRMAQVVANLLNNAAKYTKEYGRIWLTAERHEDEAIIRVRDSGVGIPREMLPHIFEMFTQVDTSRERAQGGLGIGLTLVKSLVEKHGGSVQAASAGPGQGSEFTVRLPVSEGPTTRGAEKEGEGEPREKLPAWRILVVDDNRDSGDSLSVLLKIMGNEVRTAQDGQTALEEVRTFRPHLTVLDIGMPGMSGYELARRLREQPELRGMVLVALTGWGQEADCRRSREAGFDHHLTKPADLAALQAVLASLTHDSPSAVGAKGE